MIRLGLGLGLGLLFGSKGQGSLRTIGLERVNRVVKRAQKWMEIRDFRDFRTMSAQVY